MVSWGVTGREKQTDRELNFAAEWQGQADLLNNLNRSDRDRLEANLRQTLGKKKGKKGASKKGGDKKGSKTSVPVSAGSDRGFGAAVAGRGEGGVPQASVCGFQREAGGGGLRKFRWPPGGARILVLLETTVQT